MKLTGEQRRRRRRLLALIGARLTQIGVDQNPAAVLDPEALAELTALLETVPDPAADLKVAHAAGWLHWYRYLVLEPVDDQQDLADAMAFFVPVFRTHPDAVPDEIRAHLGRLAASDDPRAVAHRAATLLQETLNTGDLATLDTVIDLLRQALAATPADHPDRAQMLANLAGALQAQFERTGDKANLDTAITVGQQAVSATPADHPDRAPILSNLGRALQIRFKGSGDLADLDAAITARQQAVAATPADHPDRAEMLANLGDALRARFEGTRDLADLDAAITARQQALAATPADHPNLAPMLANLSIVLRIRFERTGDLPDLDTAIGLLGQAVAATPADHPDHARMLANLGVTLRIRFERTGDLPDLDTAIGLLRQAVAATPAGHPDQAGKLSQLGIALQARFERAGDLADLDAAITVSQQALAATPADHPDHARWLSNLGTALQARFERTGDQADLDTAVGLLGQAVAATPAGHPDQASMLANLGGALRIRFERAGDLADLDTAIGLLGQAVAATPAGDPKRAMDLSQLGLALRARFERAGDLADLDAALTAGRQAVAAIPADHPTRAMWLSNLGGTLQARFERTGDQADLDTAIGLLRQAVAATPADQPDHAGKLANLGIALQRRFERAGDLADLDAAITASRQAVAAIPAGHPDHAMNLSNLGVALQARFERTGDQVDLDTAVGLLRQAVAATPADHPNHALMQNNLSSALQRRFERAGDLADLDAAIGLLGQALAAISADYPGRAEWLSNLGRALERRFERTGNPADLDAALTADQQAVAANAGSPRVRAITARRWGRAAADGGRWQEAVAGFAAAAELQGLVAPRSLTRTDQEHLLEELGSLGADAAACCVQAGLTERAVELFEQGRGVLLGQALDTRTDLTALSEQHPDLAARFTVLRDNLDRADDSDGPLAAMSASMGGALIDSRAGAAHRDVEGRRAAVTAFDRVVMEIRDLPGFHGFLRPSPVAELLPAAAEGPVVVVTVSRFGSYALILTSSGVLTPLPLPLLAPETVYDRVVAFLSALDDAGSPIAGPGGWATAEQRLGDTLGWLWEALASPVLDQLGITGPPQDGEPWPRLWWCVSGLLSFLPVHVAGHHRTRADAAPATVIDRVISSYTPTIRALAHARRSRPAAAGEAGARPGGGVQVVAVAMPHTPGTPDLPGAQAEAAVLQQRFPGQVTVLTGDRATHDAVLAALPAGRWAHFACHGTSDLDNPSASCLLLADHQQRPLTVTDVARLRLDDAGLAFLSACSTARPGGRLADEAIHLASAFQLAGYRHVIATLWPIGDQQAVDITADIYTTLTATGEDDVAGAVHAAVRRTRRLRGWDTPSAWASHIHAGA